MDRKEYFEQVESIGDDIVLSLDLDDDASLDEQYHRQVHELQNEHPLVTDENLAIEVLRSSNYPTAEFFHHGTAMKSDETNCGKARFPFGSCAAGALAEDVNDYLCREYRFNGSLTKKMVKSAQAKLKV